MKDINFVMNKIKELDKLRNDAYPLSLRIFSDYSGELRGREGSIFDFNNYDELIEELENFVYKNKTPIEKQKDKFIDEINFAIKVSKDENFKDWYKHYIKNKYKELFKD